ncbi:MAG: Zn-dependent exopeptidase M28 [Candidatus Thermoplasmatota archaeon]|nr:Zn-dependent exopeptidase M28 [Candidatus Thermoplasmatota archaeon]
MKKKIVSLVLCMLMILSLIPVVGSLQTGDAIISGSVQPRPKAPGPGAAPNPPSDSITDVPLIRSTPQKTPATMDDIVISMIEQVDTTLYLHYLENITGFGPRYTGTASCIAAAQYIYEQFQSMGLWARYHPWSYGGYSSNNVEATINGTDTSSDEIYIVCGHYDTVASSPGADDDGSGTVAVLIAAYVMSQHQFNYTIKFVAFSGEEEGLYGSRIYAQQAAAQGWNIAGVLNADMISYAITTSHGNNVDVYVNSASTWLYTYTVNVGAEYNDYIHLTLHNAGTSSGSDHYYFWQNGYSAIFYFEYEMTPYYHTSGDTIDHINATYAVKNVKLILATLAELGEASYLSNAPAKPILDGPTTGVINVQYIFNATTTEPDGEDVYYYFDWGDGTNSGWLGPYSPGTQITEQKSWTTVATYTVQARAKDIHDVTSEWSDPIMMHIINDVPPNTPSITGKTRGAVGTPYTYTFRSTDPNADDVYYYIEWGDGNTTEWAGPYESGEDAEISHQWDTKGTYLIKAKAKDIYGIESNWGTLSVVMPKDTSYVLTGVLQRLFEIFPRAFPILRHLMGY